MVMRSKPPLAPRPSVDLSLMDRIIGVFSPSRAYRRAIQRAVSSSSFQGGDRTRRVLKNWLPTVKSADAAMEYDLDTLRERSRDAVRSQPLAHGALHTLRSKAIGVGLRPIMRIDRELLRLRGVEMTEKQATDLELAIESYWRVWTEDKRSDRQRTLPHNRQSGLAFLSYLEAGDCLGLFSMVQRPGWEFETSIQLVEADRLSNPDNLMDGASAPGSNRQRRLYKGVEKTMGGEPVAYWVRSTHPGEVAAYSTTPKWSRFRALTGAGDAAVLHLFDPERIDQSRGLPALSCVLEKLKALSGYSESELEAALISSWFTVFVKSPNPTAEARAFAEALNADGSSNESDAGEIEMGPGIISQLAPGEDITISNPGRPNVNYEPFSKAQLREIGAGTGLGLEPLLKAFESSYSAARAALLEAWLIITMHRSVFVSCWEYPTLVRFVKELAAKGMIEVPMQFWTDSIVQAAIICAEFIGPARGQIDERNEIEAAVMRIEAGMSTLQDETAALTGKDWRRVIQDRAWEIREKQKAVGPDTAPPPPHPDDPGEDDPDTNENDDEDEVGEQEEAE